jgi:prevent-host-death family protein
MLKTIESNEAEKKIKSLLDEVSQGTNQYIFKKNEQNLAVLLSYEDFNVFKRLVQSKARNKERFFEIVDQIRQRNKNIPFEQIENDVAQAVAEVRQAKSSSNQ